ncbi:hypothetical protein [Catenovulum sediminis]|uniref:DUF2982 domain-containing protein n=1 Tax=Catenovulum sediminis TaxID=1740262 RepID=A0ABV1RCL8_9ALTE
MANTIKHRNNENAQQNRRKIYSTNERDISVLSKVLFVILTTLISFAIYAIYDRAFNQLLPLILPVVTSISVLIIVKTSNRLVLNSQIVLVDERNWEIKATADYLIKVTQDLKGKLGFLKVIYENDLSQVELFITIESVCECFGELNKPEHFKLLGGDYVDRLVAMSPYYHGLRIGLKVNSQPKDTNKQTSPVSCLQLDSSKLVADTKNALIDTESVLDILYELRMSISK